MKTVHALEFRHYHKTQLIPEHCRVYFIQNTNLKEFGIVICPEFLVPL